MAVGEAGAPLAPPLHPSLLPSNRLEHTSGKVSIDRWEWWRRCAGGRLRARRAAGMEEIEGAPTPQWRRRCTVPLEMEIEGALVP
jgi:hypothetical protein